MWPTNRMNFFSQRKALTSRGFALLLLLVPPAYASAQVEDSGKTPAQEEPTNNKEEPADKSARGQRVPDQSPSTAEITAVPNRPTFSTTAEAVQGGALEMEYGTELADGHQNINGLIKFGILKNLELRFANNPFERDDRRAGLGDSGAGFKYRIISQRGALPTFSVLYTASLSTSTGTPGIGAMDHGADLLVSKDFGKHHFDFNEGVRFLGRPHVGGYDRNYFTALDYSHPLPGKWGYTVELAGFSRANAAKPPTMTVLLATTYNVSPRLVLDGGEYTAAYGNLPRGTFFLGVTYAIADLYHLHRTTPTVSRKP